MTKDLLIALQTYLSGDIVDEERTIRKITQTLRTRFKNVTKLTIIRILRNSDQFTPVKKIDDDRVYWYLTEEYTSRNPSDDIERIYVFIDCDNSPNIFYYLSEIAKSCDTLVIRGYAGPYYSINKARKYLGCKGTDRVMFHQTKSTTKDAADVVMILDLYDMLITNPTTTCYIISSDGIFLTLADEIRRRFPESNIIVSKETNMIKEEIFACI